jgi:hypothetical protein
MGNHNSKIAGVLGVGMWSDPAAGDGGVAGGRWGARSGSSGADPET